ncbi:phosphotransferase family protein [Paraoerskovia sediminicola]|uniref:phosphotransferase family protein n=1 Tax=Paraoerskovia sediminicola TaxID=1138587 RepID=UPI0025732501|nr:aminoglycoside phosphotransferase family protein [Paraoerskovia sediminicola]
MSNVVLAIQDGDRRVVLKQSRERLAVAEEWLAPRERIVREAQGLRVARELTPAVVPEVLDLDTDDMTMTIAGAPRGWVDWKAELMAGRVDESVGAVLGDALGAWQEGTRGGARLPQDLCDDTATFISLRVDPYHRTAARRNPEVRDAVDAVVQRMADTREVLVHGDLSPKNVLVGPLEAGGPNSAWVLDLEVAHLGDPLFDPAFLLTHLHLKGVHRPAGTAALRRTASAFAAAYTARTGPVDAPALGAHVGALLLARVDGKSPAEYLDAAARDLTRRTAIDLLTTPVTSTGDLWDRLWRTS